MQERQSMLRYAGAAVLSAVAVVALAGLGYAAAGAGGATAVQYEYPTTTGKKVTICHHTQGKKGTKHVTITVSRNALPAHLRHGDTVGPCNSPRNKKIHSSPAHVKKFHKSAKAGKAGKAGKPAKAGKPGKPPHKAPSPGKPPGKEKGKKK